MISFNTSHTAKNFAMYSYKHAANISTNCIKGTDEQIENNALETLNSSVGVCRIDFSCSL